MVYRMAPFSMTDLEPPLTQMPGHSLTLNISEIAKETVIVTMEGE